MWKYTCFECEPFWSGVAIKPYRQQTSTSILGFDINSIHPFFTAPFLTRAQENEVAARFSAENLIIGLPLKGSGVYLIIKTGLNKNEMSLYGVLACRSTFMVIISLIKRVMNLKHSHTIGWLIYWGLFKISFGASKQLFYALGAHVLTFECAQTEKENPLLVRILAPHWFNPSRGNFSSVLANLCSLWR